jgi:alpha-L-rhamnosidase
MKIHCLRTEYLVNPLGIDEQHPRFSYLIESDEYNKSQSAYRILVASNKDFLNDDKFDLWDSGKVPSSKTSQIKYNGKALRFGQQCYFKCIVFDESDNRYESRENAFFTVGFLQKKDIKAKFIYFNQGINEDELASPVCFAKKAVIHKEIKSAYVYASALGVFNLKINSKDVSENILAPEWTSYFKHVQYQTYEITKLLQNGNNEISVFLSNGWYSGLWQKWPPRNHIYGGKYPEFFCQLEIEYSDGTFETIITDESWRTTNDIPIRFAGIYEGETYDATVSYPLLSNINIWRNITLSDKTDTLILSSQKSEPIKVTEKLIPIKITEPKSNIYVVDFGQNFAGRISAKFYEKANSEITIKHNEVLNEDGTVYMDNLITCLFFEKADRQILRYTCRGYNDVYTPSFTYMGFRYIEITGLNQPPSPDDFTGEVFHTSFKQVGSFSCSNNEINRLQQNIVWSQRSNMMGVPTDCPQRDERCGYTGDMQFFMPTAVMNMDMAAFMNKWLTDLCEYSQFPDGSYKDHAPDFGMNGGIVGWGDAGIICPYLCYKTYGDILNIEKHFISMKRYMEFLVSTANPDYTRGPDCVGLGDWLSMGGGASLEVIGTAYFAYILFIFSEMAEAIGKHDDYNYYFDKFEKVKTAFSNHFILNDGKIKDSSLTGYALAITMDLVPIDKMSMVIKAFADEVENQNYKLTTGFLGTPRLLIALGQVGRNDLAEKLLMQRECPSWLYPVTVGATTIWERWNGWTKEKGYEWNGMNSFNHFAFGSVGDYFFRYILGISQKNTDTSFEYFIIKPTVPESLSYAKGSYEGINGKIDIHWKKENDYIHLSVKIPTNTKAEIVLPSGAKMEPLKSHDISQKIDSCSFICGSGKYIFKYIKK